MEIDSHSYSICAYILHNTSCLNRHLIPIPTITLLPSVTPPSIPDLSAYAFPVSIDPSKQYLFYLHGKIIEDQGIPAISPDYGEYEYEAILEKLASYEFVVISEQRPKNTDGMEYANKVVKQVTELLKAGVRSQKHYGCWRIKRRWYCNRCLSLA